MSGFTLTNGDSAYVYLTNFDGIILPVYDEFGGGLRGSPGAVVSNCFITGNVLGAYGGVLVDCMLTNNARGAASVTLNRCFLTGNYAGDGGAGAYNSILNNCSIIGNSVTGSEDDDISYGSGGGVLKCVLNQCLILSNTAAIDGGGASQSKLTNCILSGNTAAIGGGASASTLVNCKLIGNYAEQEGGGAFESWLYNSTLASNSSGNGGGARFSRLTNCIAVHNTATNGANHLDSSFHFSCTTPLPVDGTGNLTNDPAFLDLAGGNFRLASNSPCLNAGDNTFAPGMTDLDGRARIAGGTVDMGAYEFQPGVSGVFLGWLEQFGLRTDGTDDTSDTDGDRANNFQEWRAGTIPTNALSALRLLMPTASGPDLVLRWASVPGKSYFLTRSTNLVAGAGLMPLAQNLPGASPTQRLTRTRTRPAAAAQSTSTNWVWSREGGAIENRASNHLD